MMNATEFSREFTAAIRKLNEAIITFNRLAGYTNWNEVKFLINKAKEEVNFIINDEQNQCVQIEQKNKDEEFISLKAFVNEFQGRFSLNAITTRLKEDQTFFKKCARKNENNQYEIRKEAAIRYLSSRSGPLPFRIRKFMEEKKLKEEGCQ